MSLKCVACVATFNLNLALPISLQFPPSSRLDLDLVLSCFYKQHNRTHRNSIFVLKQPTRENRTHCPSAPTLIVIYLLPIFYLFLYWTIPTLGFFFIFLSGRLVHVQFNCSGLVPVQLLCRCARCVPLPASIAILAQTLD